MSDQASRLANTDSTSENDQQFERWRHQTYGGVQALMSAISSLNTRNQWMLLAQQMTTPPQSEQLMEIKQMLWDAEIKLAGVLDALHAVQPGPGRDVGGPGRPQL